MSLLQMSLAASVMIIAVIILRSLFLNKLPKTTFQALWGLVVLRLVLPFEIPSPLSIYSALSSAQSFIESDAQGGFSASTIAQNAFSIADSLTGDSIYTAEDLAQAIKTLKAKITANEQKLAEMDVEIEQQSNSLSAINLMYDSFLGWANEFDNAALEQQKMIIGQLIKRVELEKGYKVHIEFNMDYEQFCTDWSRETSTNTMALCCG